MDKMDRNKLWSFVEEEESTVEKVMDGITLDDDDPIENEIGARLNEIEYALRSLDNYLREIGLDKR